MDRLWVKGGRRLKSHESSFLHALKRRGSQTSRDIPVVVFALTRLPTKKPVACEIESLLRVFWLPMNT
jgi:hypothetical protein